MTSIFGGWQAVERLLDVRLHSWALEEPEGLTLRHGLVMNNQETS